jgi:parvulin-like peptidyl-prolyl isomerase
VIGGQVIGRDEVAAALGSVAGKKFGEASPELVAAVFEDLVEQEVLLASSPRTSDRDLASPARAARARELLLSLCAPPPAPTDAQVRALLAQQPQMTPSSDRVRLRQLILPDAATARAVRDRIRAGGDFVAISRELSRAPNARDGGMIGWVERGQLPPEFEAAVFGLAASEVSEPVESNAGWHVFQVMSRSSGGDETARDRARNQLASAAAAARRRECLRGMAAKVQLVIKCTDAPFPCRNPFEEPS